VDPKHADSPTWCSANYAASARHQSRAAVKQRVEVEPVVLANGARNPGTSD
jgi:hypothetical protein